MRERISGEDFYDVIVDLGEDITFLTDPEIKQYASIKPHRTTNTTEGAYWYKGVMTFEDVYQQNRLIGEYFKRQTNSEPKHILTAVMSENTTPKIATVYAVECNDVVDIISHYEKGDRNEFGVEEQIPVYLAKNVDVYISVVQKPLIEQTTGAFVETLTNMIIPAKYAVSPDNVILKEGIVFDDDLKKNVLKKVPFRIQSVDPSMMDIIAGQYVGILRCSLREDIR